jgi:hypothetical protein
MRLSFPSCLLPLGFPTQICIQFSSLLCVLHDSRLSIWSPASSLARVQVTKQVIKQPSVLSSLVGPNILVIILFSDTFNLCSYLVKHEVSHPYKTLDNISFLYYSRTSNNGHCQGIQILSVIGGVR